MKKIVFLFIVLSALVQLPAKANFDDFYKISDQFFQKYVYRGMVNYQAIYETPTQLKELVEIIGQMPLDEKSNEEVRKSFYLNAYNILVINGIIDNFPTASPLDIPGFFDKQRYNVAGKFLTLSDLENKVIRKEFNDPRIHFALVCAAKGCPPISSAAYKPQTVDGMLERQTITAVSNVKFVSLADDGSMVYLSQIFEWYAEDFATEEDNTPISFINQYLTRKLPMNLEIEYFEYDWTLNTTKDGGK